MVLHDESSIESLFLDGARPYLLIVLIGLLLYSSAAFFGFSYLDDNILILQNKEFIGKLSNIPMAFKQDVFHVLREYDAAYRPLLTVSFMADAQLDKIFGSGYHLSNILFHLIQSCLAFLLFLKLKQSRALAFSFALIFTVHPALTQAVAWIPGRNDLLLGIFTLISFIFFLEYLERGKWAYCAVHIIFMVLALFTKESAIVIPAVCIFYFYFIFKGSLFSTRQAGMLLCWLFALALWWIPRGYALSFNPVKLSVIGMLRDLALASPAFFIYAGKSVLPFDLSIIPTIKDSIAIYGIVSVVMIGSGLYFSKNKRYGFILFGAAWFLSFLAPTFINPISRPSAVFFESRLYLPILGIFIMLGEMDMVKNITFKRPAGLIPVLAVTGLLFSVSISHANHFKNATAFWEYAVKKSPHSALAQSSLGWVYYMQHRYGEAEERIRRALELNPRERYAHNSLGCVYERKGLLETAEAEYAMEIKNTPHYDKAFINLANLYFRQGKMEKAEELWEKALRINPENTYVRKMLEKKGKER